LSLTQKLGKRERYAKVSQWDREAGFVPEVYSLRLENIENLMEDIET